MPAPRRRRAQADTSEEKKTTAEPSKPAVNKSNESVNRSAETKPAPAINKTMPTKKEPSIIAPDGGAGGKGDKSLPIISGQHLDGPEGLKKKDVKTDPKGPSGGNKKAVQEPIKEQALPEEINFIDQMRPFSLRGGFNKPGFLRKGKKVAEDFSFATENVAQNTAVDVVKPYETDRSKQQKLNNYDFKDYEFPSVSSSLGVEHRDKESVWKQPN